MHIAIISKYIATYIATYVAKMVKIYIYALYA